jgi:hypothetical protein
MTRSASSHSASRRTLRQIEHAMRVGMARSFLTLTGTATEGSPIQRVGVFAASGHFGFRLAGNANGGVPGRRRAALPRSSGDVARTPVDTQRQHAPRERKEVQRLADALFDLSDDPTRANVMRYLAASRALEESRQPPARACRRKAA